MNILKQFLIFLFFISSTFLVAQEKSKVDTLVEGDFKMMLFYTPERSYSDDFVYTDGFFYSQIGEFWDVPFDSVNIFSESIRKRKNAHDADSIRLFYKKIPFNGVVMLCADKGRGLTAQTSNLIEYDIAFFSGKKKLPVAEIVFDNGSIVQILNHCQTWIDDARYKTEIHFKNHKAQGTYKGEGMWEGIYHLPYYFNYQMNEGKFEGSAIFTDENKTWKYTYRSGVEIDTSFYFKNDELKELEIHDKVGLLKKAQAFDKGKVVVEMLRVADSSSSILSYEAFYPNGKLKVEGSINQSNISY